MRNYRQDVVLNKFLLYRFWSNEFRQSLNRDSRGSNITNLNQDLLAKLTVAFPNVDKQREIISFLDKKCAEIDSAIDKKQALIDKMAEYKKSLIYETITGKLEV
jgi:type I restriction enzyme S subunit